MSLRPLSASTPRASIWPPPQAEAWPTPSQDADQPAATTRQVVGQLASSTHETPSLRECDEQDQQQENEPHVHTAAADAHGRCRYKSHLSLSQQPLVGHKVRPVIAKDSPKRSGTKGIKSVSDPWSESKSHIPRAGRSTKDLKTRAVILLHR